MCEKSNENSKPKWDEEKRELSLNDTLCRKYRSQRAQNQIRILVEFEELGWPPRIDDPLPRSDKVDQQSRLSDTVRGLNSKCKGIKFELDGTSEGVKWKTENDGNEPSPSDDLPF